MLHSRNFHLPPFRTRDAASHPCASPLQPCSFPLSCPPTLRASVLPREAAGPFSKKCRGAGVQRQTWGRQKASHWASPEQQLGVPCPSGLTSGLLRRGARGTVGRGAGKMGSWRVMGGTRTLRAGQAFTHGASGNKVGFTCSQPRVRHSACAFHSGRPQTESRGAAPSTGTSGTRTMGAAGRAESG